MSKGIRLCDHFEKLMALSIRCYELLNDLIDFRAIIEFKFPAERICENGLRHVAIEARFVVKSLSEKGTVIRLEFRQLPMVFN
jgi:hypothetical protein